MSKFIKLNQDKPDSETRTKLYDDLEKSINEKEKAIDLQKEQLDDMQQLDQAKSEDRFLLFRRFCIALASQSVLSLLHII